jgi:putative Holliday junction resolvase
MPATPEAGALVFDHGGRRIGVAYANPVTGMTTAVAVVAAREGEPDWPAIDRLVAEWQPGCLVVGVPYNGGGGSEAAAEGFADALAHRCPLPVHRVDERLSSAEAEDRLREQRRSGLRRRKVRTGDVDAEAARIIGEAWLASQQRNPSA